MIRLFELRTEKELSQRKMAKELNISQGTYNNWENSNTQPSIEQLIQLAGFFGVSVDYLIGNTDEFGTVLSSRPLTREEDKILALFNSLSSEQKNAVTVILENLAGNK